MLPQERRRHFLIDKSLQFRYLFILASSILVFTSVSLLSLYFGIWGQVLQSFSDEKVQVDLVTASRLQQYEEARISPDSAPAPETEISPLSFFRQAERLSERQQEIFKEILNKTNKTLAWQLVLLLVLVAAGSIFISHKIAGPLYRFEKVLYQMSQGDLSVRCRLRKFDEARSVANAFNFSLEFLDQKIAQLKKIVRENERDPERLISSLKNALEDFKTSADH